MFGREVRAPVDLVFETPADDPPSSYDSYTVNLENRMKQAFGLVRKHLGVAAERMKRQYDLRVRPQTYRRGQWVLYYNPRKYQGKQQKWQRKFSPYLIIKELPPVNYLIQKSGRSRPIVAHVDKLKSWNIDNPPKSWLTNESPQPDSSNIRPKEDEDEEPGEHEIPEDTARVEQDSGRAVNDHGEDLDELDDTMAIAGDP